MGVLLADGCREKDNGYIIPDEEIIYTVLKKEKL
jgi:hypothetical protein